MLPNTRPTSAFAPDPSANGGIPRAISGENAETPVITITVVHGKRSAKLSVPTSTATIELIPGIAKHLGVLDPTLAYGGYQLIRPDGTALISDLSMSEQTVENGEHLTLLVNALSDQDIVYDDIVEAVGDSVTRSHHPWTRENTTLTSLIISCGVLVVSALCLAVSPSSLLTAGISIICAAALLGIAAILNAKHMGYQALSIALTACLLAAVGGYHCATVLSRPQPAGLPGNPFASSALAAQTPNALPAQVYMWPALGAGLALLVFGGLTVLLVSQRHLHALLPMILGVSLSVISGCCIIWPTWTPRIWTLAIAVIGLCSAALPWLSLSMARLSVDSPNSESEIFALPKTVDIADVRRRYRFGSTILFDIRAAAAILTVVSVPIIVSNESAAGLCMVLVIFANMLLDSRRVYAQSEMMVTVIGAGVGLCATIIACVLSHAQWVPLAVTACAVGALICVVSTQLAQRDSITMTRVADAADAISVVAILPLAYLTWGL
jgi:type VII secretion integral membrane protein EccD